MKDCIGIFDSGIGGLSVYEEIRKRLPDENIIYLADEANCPYGTKTREEVRAISIKNIETLMKMGAKLVVIACNTATSSIVDTIEENPNRLIGVIQPTALVAKQHSKGRIGLFATDLTVKSGVYQSYLNNELKFAEGCSDLVPHIEAHDYNSQEMKEMILSHAEKMKNIDTLILGCTHFKFIKKEIQSVLPHVVIVDSGEPTCNILIDILTKTHSFERNHQDTKTIYVTTGDETKAREQLKSLHIIFDEIYHKDI